MKFNIIVCIKQVPDTSDIKWTKNNTIQRDGLDSILNPYDVGAIQLAKNVKYILKNRNIDVEITAVTMGPPQAENVLKTAIAMGCDKGALLTDKKFSGADTLATAYTLSQFIKEVIPDFKMIICGQQAIDGDTAQTPSSMAEKLNINQITSVVALKEINEAYSLWIKDTKTATEEIKSGFPLLIATTLSNTEIIPDINGYIKAQKAVIDAYDANKIKADNSKIGLSGSPTQVKKAFKYEISRDTMILEDNNIDNCAEFIINEINKCRENNV